MLENQQESIVQPPDAAAGPVLQRLWHCGAHQVGSHWQNTCRSEAHNELYAAIAASRAHNLRLPSAGLS
jgi:hypothetical protein